MSAPVPVEQSVAPSVVRVATTTGGAPGGAVVGDGTTAASRAGRRWRRVWPVLAFLGVVAVGGLLAVLPEPRTSTTPLAPDNPAPTGARALAQVLGRHGVDVDYVRRIADVRSTAGPGSTLLVVGDYLIEPAMAAAIDDTGADLVLVEAPGVMLTVTDQLVPAAGPSGTGTVRDASCADPDAQAARTLVASGAVQATGPDAVICFPDPATGPDGSGAYATVTDGTRRIAVLADSAPLTNAELDDEGNAALALRALGRHEHLVWYVPSLGDTGMDDATGGEPDLLALLPPVAPVLAAQLLVVVLAVALWRGRRLGRVVVEEMPVVVRSGETTRGRGRLYRRARAHGHAAAALRAGTASRLAARLGLPRSAPAPALIDAVAAASGRPTTDVAALLYGPPPTDDTGLARLARDLDRLESEVHRS